MSVPEAAPYINALVSYLLCCLVAFALLAGYRLLIAFAVYNDAQAKQNENPVMWAVLCGLLGLIPEIIYLCVRNNSSKRPVACPSCGLAYLGTLSHCPNCQGPNPTVRLINPQESQQQKRAKIFMIVGLALLVAGVLAIVFGFSFIFQLIFVTAQPGVLS